MYKVDTRHTIDPVDDFIEGAAKRVMQIHCAQPERRGDVLVFMPGKSCFARPGLSGGIPADQAGSEEIETCVELLRRVAKELPPDSTSVSLPPS